MISIADLHFRYQDSGADVLRGVNLEIAPGEFVVLTGPSGCGKSTLALAIGGYLFRQYNGRAGGRVTVDGMAVRERPIYDIAEVVGLVQQNPEAQFCTLTVRDEVAFGLENRRLPPPEIEKRLQWALQIVGAEDLENRPLAKLSGGEKQKVAIAAVMAAKPQVLIFDEPTSNLDPSATAEIFGVIAHIRAKAGITVIVIEHKLDFLRGFEPRLIEMAQGQVVYDGPYSEHRRPAFPPPHAGPIPHPTSCPQPLVRVDGVWAGYNGQTVLRDLSLELCPGQLVAVMGDNGSGKTTFLRLLLGLLAPDRGQVCIGDRDTQDTPVSQLARQVGFVFQNPDHQLFAETVWQEATFAARNFDLLNENRAADVGGLLDHCGLGNRRQDHPYRLSYGEKRRLNLISILAHDPSIILLDELLIGQDPRNAAFLMDLLQEQVARGRSAVMVSHDPDVVQAYANRIVFFQNGEVLVDAPTDAAFAELAKRNLSVYLSASYRTRPEKPLPFRESQPDTASPDRPARPRGVPFASPPPVAREGKR